MEYSSFDSRAVIKHLTKGREPWSWTRKYFYKDSCRGVEHFVAGRKQVALDQEPFLCELMTGIERFTIWIKIL